MGSVRSRGLVAGASLPVFSLNAAAMRSIRETAATPFRAGKMLALTDSSPHLWFSP
ncbi:hypothetical protein FRZ44_35370 [Hypericibacter terrae]|uniref:Uncharacterized protein n=2 Tax=Hypericibacter terrae TaxID=2602015 RepID=A0A5J6MKW1_9PROT|nr:hypothetical protein FRZ44_35370 [Hypericibacter terrae]